MLLALAHGFELVATRYAILKKTASGKVDRHGLREREAAGA